MSFFSACWLVIIIATMTFPDRHPNFVNGYPSGAGSCISGKAAVGGYHLTKSTGRTIKPQQTLASKAVTVTIGSVTATAGKTISLKSNTPYSIKVSGKGMKGILVRIAAASGVSTTGVLSAGSGTKTASVCKSPVVGITHKSSTTVSSYGGTLKFPKATSGVTMDITIVYSASSTLSEYAYGRITMNFT